MQPQCWRGLRTCMQLHEKRPVKRAGVAGIALRAELIRHSIFKKINTLWMNVKKNSIDIGN
ncbi:hypothetical protein DVP71_11975 [Yersinia enterocolitica]|nr:hypothetical protein [Yersinia enterocolitica]